MSNKQIVFETELEGYVNIGKPGGNYNNCSMGFCLPDEIHAQLDKDRAEMLERVVYPKGKTPQGIHKAPWDETGLLKYTFDKPDGTKAGYRPPFIDAVGDQVPIDVLNSVRPGTRVVIALEHFPYYKGKGGTTVQVNAVQITNWSPKTPWTPVPRLWLMRLSCLASVKASPLASLLSKQSHAGRC